MAKGYIRRMEHRKKSNKVDFSFCANPETAMFWETKEEAEMNCKIFDHNSIEIPSALGGIHVCKHFRTEQAESGKFVVYCEAPFIPQTKISTSIEP
jgi:hypothetical protein